VLFSKRRWRVLDAAFDKLLLPQLLHTAQSDASSVLVEVSADCPQTSRPRSRSLTRHAIFDLFRLGRSKTTSAEPTTATAAAAASSSSEGNNRQTTALVVQQDVQTTSTPGKVGVQTLDTASREKRTSEALRYGTRCQEIFQATPFYTNGTDPCLSSRSWSSFYRLLWDPGLRIDPLRLLAGCRKRQLNQAPLNLRGLTRLVMTVWGKEGTLTQLL